jgi:hypothetical protein
MEGYPWSLRIMRPLQDDNIAKLQGQISALTEKVQYLAFPKVGQSQVWSIGFYMEGHVENGCQRLRSMRPSNMAPPPLGTIGGVSKFTTTNPIHGPVQYHAFTNNKKNYI